MSSRNHFRYIIDESMRHVDLAFMGPIMEVL